MICLKNVPLISSLRIGDVFPLALHLNRPVVEGIPRVVVESIHLGIRRQVVGQGQRVIGQKPVVVLPVFNFGGGSRYYWEPC